MGENVRPTVGGWLTETYSWRLVFHLNLPLGLLAVGLMSFLSCGGQRGMRFDWLGFGVLAAFMLMREMKPDKTRFGTTEQTEPLAR